MTPKKKIKKKTRASKVGSRKAISKKSMKKKKAPQRKKPSKSIADRAIGTSKSAKTRVAEGDALDSTVLGARRVRTTSRDADSQDMSAVERADSESVGELLEEGNTFEAGVVRGVEEAEDADEREVRTREFPEDDVPEEYLDKD